MAGPLLEDNLRILSYFENEFRHVTSNQPTESPNDLNGGKIRTSESPLSLIELGIDPIHFGILMIVSFSIGFITPPLWSQFICRFRHLWTWNACPCKSSDSVLCGHGR